MLTNNLKIALRSLWRKRGFAFLNILGLAVGIASALMIFMIIRQEFSYDTFHPLKDRIYKIGTYLKYKDGSELKDGACSLLAADAFRKDFPQLDKVTPTYLEDEDQFAIPESSGATEKKFKEKEGIFFLEPAFFELFNFPWIQGDPSSLKNPNTIAISQKFATKWFGDWKSAMDKMILVSDHRTPMQIKGILQDPPTNTDLVVNVAMSYETFREQNKSDFSNNSNWGSVSSSSQCFVLLKPGVKIADLTGELAVFNKATYVDVNRNGSAYQSNVFVPFNGQHFDEQYTRYGDPSLSSKEVWAMTLIGIFLVLVACINFINLSTAQSVNRAKEIGVRKVLGSNRPQLLGQFMQETALITFISLVLACIIAELTLPSIGTLMERTFSLHLLETPWTALFLIGLGVIVTFLAGFYPGMVLSGFDPVTAFRSKIAAKSTKGISLRRGLVVTQFVIAQLLIIGTLVVIEQMSYFRNRPMGFERKTILMYDVPLDSNSQKSLPILKAKMNQLPGVVASTLCDNPPSTQDAWNTGFIFDTHTETEGYQITMRFQDSDYLKVFHMQMAAGRQPYPSDSIGELMVNETTVKRLGLHSDQEILGRTLRFSRHGFRCTIVGVMKDFNNKPLNGTVGITPVMVSASSSKGFNFLAVRYDPNNLASLMPKMAAVYNEVFPNHVPDPTFYDKMLMDNYQAETRAQKLFQIFAFLAIFISCLGLYGLVSFMAVQKFKEVGIRKVLGASVGNIIYMFSKEFTLLVGVAFLVAAPLGYYFMKLWLDGFYYRIHIGWDVFLISIVMSVVIAWITVSYKALRAALSNPIKALKYE